LDISNIKEVQDEKKLHDEKLQNPNLSPNIISVKWSGRDM